MKLNDIKNSVKWRLPKRESSARATIVRDGVTYDLTIQANKFVDDHIVGWVSKAVKHSDDMDRGRQVSIKVSDGKRGDVADAWEEVVRGVNTTVDDHHLKFVYLFSSTQSKKTSYKTLADKIAKGLKWSVYQDRNYFIVYNPSLKIHQVS